MENQTTDTKQHPNGQTMDKRHKQKKIFVAVYWNCMIIIVWCQNSELWFNINIGLNDLSKMLGSNDVVVKSKQYHYMLIWCTYAFRIHHSYEQTIFKYINNTLKNEKAKVKKKSKAQPPQHAILAGLGLANANGNTKTTKQKHQIEMILV